jgi:putative transposase
VARLGRYFLPGQPLHVIQRGNNRGPIFFDDGDYVRYRDWLVAAAARYRRAVHAYVLMTNHVHLLVTPQAADSAPGMLQSLGRRYVRHVNATYRRTGTLWEGRYRAAPIDSEAYFLACCRYIELNPVRAGMVSNPGDYPWSSHGAHADGAFDPLAAPHELYEQLGATAALRQASYRSLIGEALDDAFVADLRRATNGGWALGGEGFGSRIAAALGRRAAPLPKGRPPKVPPEDGQTCLL